MQQSALAGKLIPDGQLSFPHLRPSLQWLSESQSPSFFPHGDSEVQQLLSYGIPFAEQAINTQKYINVFVLFNFFFRNSTETVHFAYAVSQPNNYPSQKNGTHGTSACCGVYNLQKNSRNSISFTAM